MAKSWTMSGQLTKSLPMRDRATYIGSSDAKKICDRSQWNDLYLTKSGVQEPPDLSDVFVVQLGMYTEPFHINWIAKRNPTWVMRAGQFHNQAMTDEDTPLGSTPDAHMDMPDGLTYQMEVKHAGQHYRNIGEVTDFYMPQLQHHMICSGADRIYFSAIIGNREPEGVWVGRSEEYIDWYVKECDVFWGYMKGKIPPPLLDGPQATIPTALKNTIPLNGMLERDISDNNHVRELVGMINRAKAHIAEADEAKKLIKDLMTEKDSRIYVPDLMELKRNAKGTPTLRIKDSNYGLDK